MATEAGTVMKGDATAAMQLILAAEAAERLRAQILRNDSDPGLSR